MPAITPLPPAPSRSVPTTFSALADAFLAALANFVTETNVAVAAMNLNATNSVSTTSLTIGTGTQSLTVDAAKSFEPGMTVKIAYTTTPTKWMCGTLTSYNAGTGALVVEVTDILGSGGPYTAWTVTQSGPVGATGTTGAAAANAWIQTTGTFTATPASTSTLTMTTDMRAVILAGMGLKYVIGGVMCYGQVAAISDILLTVRGAPLSGAVTALYYGGGLLTEISYDASVNSDCTANVVPLKTGNVFTITWRKQTSYVVFYAARETVHDSGTHGKFTVKNAGDEINTSAGGLVIAANDTEYKTVVDIAVAKYDINDGEDITAVITQGTTVDAYGLKFTIIILTP
jgi:hypothetical protein